MASTRLLLRLLAAVVLVGSSLMLASCDRSPDVTSDNFPEKTKTRVELRPDSASEDIRYVYMADDKKTKTLTQIEYRNGVTSYVFHRTDGTAKEMKEFYPAAEGATQRQLKAQVNYDTDGKRFMSHTTFRLDGSTDRQGERTADGRYQTKWFFEDGVAVNKLRVFNKDLVLASEDVYRKDGSIASQSRRPNYYELVTKVFGEDGKLTAQLTENQWNGLSGVYYNPDSTIRAKFSDSYRLAVQYFDKGVLTLEVDYSADRMDITAYAPGDKPLYRQVWMRVGTTGEECSATYKLSNVEEYHKWGASNPRWNKEIKHTIIMNDDGTVPVAAEWRKISWSKERTVKELRPDGSAITVKHYNSDDKVISSRPGTDADAVAVKNLTKRPAFDCLPLPAKAERFKATPRNYYYGDF